ncbi:ubiquinol-cytochrome-c reductase complex subunit-domain-containing protein, partial [Endogone sp. FLAS-F59071]
QPRQIPGTSTTNVINISKLHNSHSHSFAIPQMPVSRIRSNPSFLGVTPEKVIRLAPNAAVWGVAAGVGILFFANGVPIFQRDILQKIPVIGSYWKKAGEGDAGSE